MITTTGKTRHHTEREAGTVSEMRELAVDGLVLSRKEARKARKLWVRRLVSSYHELAEHIRQMRHKMRQPKSSYQGA